MGYSVMARIVEAVSGRSWEAYLDRHVWRPLGLRATGFRFGAPRPGTAFANGYLENVRQPLISTRIASLGGNDWALRGNGGMQASADDMVRFFGAIVGEDRAIAPAARAIMMAPHGPSTENVREGYGLFFRSTADGMLWRIGHGGSDGVFFSYLGWYPRSETLFYFVGNNGETPVRAALRPVLEAVGSLPAR
jgi:CubicO group peptidase (beta-lactamase class C family)